MYKCKYFIILLCIYIFKFLHFYLDIYIFRVLFQKASFILAKKMHIWGIFESFKTSLRLFFAPGGELFYLEIAKNDLKGNFNHFSRFQKSIWNAFAFLNEGICVFVFKVYKKNNTFALEKESVSVWKEWK